MKGKEPRYDKSSVTFWPFRTVAIGGMCLFGFIGASSLMMAIVQTFSPSRDVILAVIAFALTAISLYTMLAIMDLKDRKVVINESGIEIFKKQETKALSVSWKEVTEIKYEAIAWYGIEFLVVTYKNLGSKDSPLKLPLQSIRLPIGSVEKEKLDCVVPRPISNK